MVPADQHFQIFQTSQIFSCISFWNLCQFLCRCRNIPHKLHGDAGLLQKIPKLVVLRPSSHKCGTRHFPAISFHVSAASAVSQQRYAFQTVRQDQKQKISPLILCNIWQQDHGCRCCHQKRSCSAPLYPVRITEQGHIIQILLFLSQYIKQHEYRCQPCHTPKCPKAPCSSHK